MLTEAIGELDKELLGDDYTEGEDENYFGSGYKMARKSSKDDL